MFTGIIRQLGIVQKVEQKNEILKITIESPLFKKMAIGDSVAVDGVCLTVTAQKKNTASFDVIPETQQKTTLKHLTKNTKVHLEEPLKLGDRLHGHILLGHIDCTAKIAKINKKEITITVPPHIQKKIAQKGSIGINGVSLTVARMEKNQCTVALIPETFRKTTFQTKNPGDKVNIEIDLPQRYSAHLPQKSDAKIAIVAGKFNQFIVEKLLNGAVKGLQEKGITNPLIVWVPGAFEIPLTAQKLALSKKYDAIITLGVIIKGETEHYEHVCQETAHGIAQVGLETGIPVIFEVLMCDTVAKALARATDDMKNNKGYHAAAAALDMIHLFKNL